MNHSPAPVDLACEADFQIGHATIRPAFRQFVACGIEEILEPRVMQALVVLAQRREEVVGYEELVGRCWEGRFVSDDAIQRAIAKLRRLGEASGIFAIETIRKVGYRMSLRGDAPEAAVAAELGQRDRPSTAALSYRDRKPSVAVLPFVNRSGVTEDDFFADGMVDDLTCALSLSRRIKVLAASAAAAFRSGPRDLRKIGCELGVGYLLEGNVRRLGDNLRVTAQLVDSHDGEIVWTQRFDRPLNELSNIQEDLVTEVAACLGVEVLRAEMEHALRKPDDITAWEAVLRAEANVSRQTLTAVEAAIVEARKAIAIDPGYDAAHAVLAIALAMRMMHSGDRSSERIDELQDVIAKACSFQSQNPLVISRIGTAMSIIGKIDEALPLIERAVSLNPNLETPHIALGNVLASMGRLEEAIAEFDAADRIAPNGIWTHAPAVWRSVAHFRVGRLSDALASVELASQLVPSIMAETQRVVCLLTQRRDDDARIAMCRLIEIVPDVSWQAIDNFLRMGPYREDVAAGCEGRIDTVKRLWNVVRGET